MEPTVVIALITALAAIISPVITAIINNHNSVKLKCIEEKENRLNNIDLHEREVLEKALSGIGILMGYKEEKSVIESCKCILTATAYVDSKTGEQLRDVVSSVMNHNTIVTMDDFSEICDAMKIEIAKRTDG